MGTVMAVYIGRAGGSPLTVGLVLTTYFFGWTVFAPIWGSLADITGKRREVLLVTAGLATVSTFPLLVVEGVWDTLAVRTAFALFSAGHLPILLTIVSAQGGSNSRGRSIGLFSSVEAMGFSAAQLSAGVLLGLLVPWSMYLVVTAVTAVVFVAAWFIDDPTPDSSTSLSVNEVSAEVRRRLFPSKAGRAHIHTNGLKWLYIAVFLRNATVIGTSSLLPVYIITQLGLTEAMMGALLAINPIGQVVFMYLVGYVTDRFGRKPLITIGMAGSAGFSALMAVSGYPDSTVARIAIVALAFAVLAAAFSGLRVGAVSFIGDIAPPDRESELIGFRSTARGIGGVLGPIVIGSIAAVSTFETAFLVGSLFAVVGAGLVAFTLVESLETGPSAVAGTN
ncbi:MFS transporter [Haloferax sp. DFSO52]|uniref:MFS transporter n=1 Tax=Haloferax sp. DFSO52 TaxID=3388505 RepID=UPI003A891E96